MSVNLRLAINFYDEFLTNSYSNQQQKKSHLEKPISHLLN